MRGWYSTSNSPCPTETSTAADVQQIIPKRTSSLGGQHYPISAQTAVCQPKFDRKSMRHTQAVRRPAPDGRKTSYAAWLSGLIDPLAPGQPQNEGVETERVGFEPTEGCPSNDFESFAFDHSATSPGGGTATAQGQLAGPEGIVPAASPLKPAATHCHRWRARGQAAIRRSPRR